MRFFKGSFKRSFAFLEGFLCELRKGFLQHFLQDLKGSFKGALFAVKASFKRS